MMGIIPLAKMAATFALRHARAVGRGIGPVIAHPGFATEPSLLPQLSLEFASPDEGAVAIESGPEGLGLLLLRFPKL